MSVWLCNNCACSASGLIPSFILCTPVLNSYSAQPNFGAPASPAGSNPARPGGFPGTNSPGPVADLYGTASQDSGVGNYISAASPQPGSGFGHGIAVSSSRRSHVSSSTASPARDRAERAVGGGQTLVLLQAMLLDTISSTC